MGVGSKAVWNLSEKSSVLVARNVPLKAAYLIQIILFPPPFTAIENKTRSERNEMWSLRADALIWTKLGGFATDSTHQVRFIGERKRRNQRQSIAVPVCRVSASDVVSR